MPKFVVCLMPLLVPLWAQPPLEEILEKLAANQERAQKARESIVYRQEVFARILRTNGKLGREERRVYTVTPGETGSTKKLDSLSGRYAKDKDILPYTEARFHHKDVDLDADILDGLVNDLANDKKARDGISRDLFPLTRDEQRFYEFALHGTRKVGKVDAWQLTFKPRKFAKNAEHRSWAGEVLVHPTAFQAMSVTTKLAHGIPTAVRIMLGINLKQLGFSVAYQNTVEDLWFPVSYGTEFGLTLFFGYKRNITMAATNSEFRRATAESRIEFEAGPPAKP